MRRKSTWRLDFREKMGGANLHDGPMEGAFEPRLERICSE